MTEPDQAIIARLSGDFAAIAAYLARASADLRHLERIVAQRAPQPTYPPPQAQPYAWPTNAHWQPQAPVSPPEPGLVTPESERPATPDSHTPQPRQPVRSAVPQHLVGPYSAAGVAMRPAATPRSDGWIGKALAVAGVAVTLVGVALLLVLAAQAGILRPEFRVGAGAVLAAGLVGAGWRLNQRAGGRVGAISLAATGIAAAYIDVIAITTIYDWVAAPVGLAIAAVVAVAGLTLARQWDSEHLGLLVLIPLIGVAPAVTDGPTLLLVGFMLALAAASVPVQVGRDWIGLHAARIAAATLPLLVALAASTFSSRQSVWLAIACLVGAMLAIGSALILLRHTAHAVAMALLSAAGTMPVLAASLVVDRAVAAAMAALLAAALLVIVAIGGRLPMVSPPVRIVWSALSGVSALISVVVAFDGPVAGPVLLAMAVVAAAAGRRNQVARWCAVGFGAVGGSFYLANAPLTTLITATGLKTPIAVSTLVASLLVVAYVAVLAWTCARQAQDGVRPDDWLLAIAAVVALYAVTMFTVTAGMLLGGGEQGFFAGHVAATICWIASAAAVFRYATKLPRAQRSLWLGGGVALVAAAMAKLFLFDLGTLDGIFRVVVFIVVGLALLGMGAGYARLLTQQDDREQRA
ncbi:MAG: DUF2339 domain-containing protein [Mycobacterium sp.]